MIDLPSRLSSLFHLISSPASCFNLHLFPARQLSYQPLPTRGFDIMYYDDDEYEYECASCSMEFAYKEDCEEHMSDYGHWPECEVCPATFRSQRACNQHMNARGHWAPRYDCETCTRTFRLQGAATQHMNAMRHWAPKVPCETCSNKFHTQSAADQHMKALSHYRNYCKSCDRRFDNENNLRMVCL